MNLDTHVHSVGVVVVGFLLPLTVPELNSGLQAPLVSTFTR